MRPKHDPARYPLASLLVLDEAGFRAQFAAMPVRRAGYQRFMRNVLIACGNSADEGLVPLIFPHLQSEAPLIKGMAIWALSQLVSQEVLASYYKPCDDAACEAEWQRALAK